MTDKNNYCTNQWQIVQYPCGAGGKFLISCLMLIDKIAPWNKLEHAQQVNYFQTRLESNISWVQKEIGHPWGISFFSRTYNRNNNLSNEEFNSLVDTHASEYFNDCWSSRLVIVDHWHKPLLPSFWQQAHSVKIIVDDFELYEHLVMSKIYNVTKNKIISLLDAPVAHGGLLNAQDSVVKFQNQYEFICDDPHEFFETEVKEKPWLSPWLNYQCDDPFYFKLSELADQEKFIKKFRYFEDLYQQHIPYNELIDLHKCWINASKIIK